MPHDIAECTDYWKRGQMSLRDTGDPQLRDALKAAKVSNEQMRENIKRLIEREKENMIPDMPVIIGVDSARVRDRGVVLLSDWNASRDEFIIVDDPYRPENEGPMPETQNKKKSGGGNIASADVEEFRDGKVVPASEEG